MTAPAPTVRRGVRAFLGLTFGLTWLPFLPVVLGGPAVPLLMPFAPAIACVVVRRWVTREGFGDLGLRPDLRRAGPWLALALLWPLLATPLAGVLAAAAGLDGFAIDAATVRDSACGPRAAVLAAPVFLGEELGWRGYLQTRILPGRPLGAAAVTGIVWGVWHYPLWLTVLDLRLWLVLTMTGSLVVMSVFLGWVQLRSGTVWAPSLGHSANNTLEANLGSAVFANGGGAFAVPPGPVAALVLAETCVLLGAVAVGSRRRAAAPSERLRMSSGAERQARRALPR
jgi:membrane protease YdiL (CAAX protease family)